MIPPWTTETTGPWAKGQHITMQICFSWWKICFKLMTNFTGFPFSLSTGRYPYTLELKSPAEAFTEVAK